MYCSSIRSYMSELTASPTKEDVTHDIASYCCAMKSTRFYIMQLGPGKRYFDIAGNEERSVNLEQFSFSDNTNYDDRERLELFRFHDNRSYEELTNIFEMSIVGDNGGYEGFYVELELRLELIGFNGNRGYVHRDASELCDVQDSEDYSGAASELFSFCNGGGRYDEYSDASGLSDIQDSDSSDDDMESCGSPPLILSCDATGKLSISGKQR